VTEAELLRRLVELAEATGLRVRSIRGAPGAEGEPPAASAVCRVRGETWIVLAGTDSLEERIAVVAAALRRYAGEELAHRYLAPALRDRIRSENDSF
jgi:hypothetical protein